MKVHLNKAHFPVQSLGPGRRVGIWFQGCSIKCSGCVSLDTWGRRDATTVDVDELLAWCSSHINSGLNGITISGGEPFDQKNGLLCLLEGLIQLRSKAGSEFDLLCYTGHRFSTVVVQHADVLDLLDAIVSEPFIKHLPTQKYLCGSDNQVLRPLSKLGEALYTETEGIRQEGKHMDICVSDGAIWFAGIPRDGDLKRLQHAVERRGLKLGKLSWRA